MNEISLPTYKNMMNPTLQALRDLGGSATIEELYNQVIEIMELTDDQLEVIHNPEQGSQTKIEYRLAWTRSYLKKYGLLENSSRGIWALTKKGRETDEVEPNEVSRYYRNLRKQEAEKHELGEDDDELTWREELLKTLIQMKPDAFERLTQRMLRESGFIQVQVTGEVAMGESMEKELCV